MKELKVNGTQEFMGKEIKVIEGGFGEDCKVIIDKQLSEIHNMETSEIRKSINRLIVKNRLVLDIDYIDLKRNNSIRPPTYEMKLCLGYNNMAWSKSTSVFILSESGYKIFLNSLSFNSSIGSNFLSSYFNCNDYTIIKDYNRDELDFFGMLDDVLKSFDITIDKQYRINKFRLDGYIKKFNVAIEYDENNHIGYTQEAHYGRQELIEKELKCKFIRVCNDKSHCENIGIILSNILNLKQNYI